MNKVIFAALIAATILPAKAQLFSSESVGKALVGRTGLPLGALAAQERRRGAFVDGVIGSHNDHIAAAAIGAGASLLHGSVAQTVPAIEPDSMAAANTLLVDN